ncbi:hypothetical protein ATL17_1618 [Maritalea mobilis]|uniref:Restriction alleviation protein, Lar family n=1 Tax=Maritalea mobilis TaxID=483324 RepID=A0A4R6VTV8_9HYPH|nr:Lar family restriction alleviation protein [Maritalea mobilis]TDQ63611.1 hypothetical protein ATL17_1618 [Maritalea mobilis]
MSEKLKPCPFCGSSILDTYKIGNGRVVACRDCGGGANVNRWNTRPLEQELVEALKDLTDACDNFGVSGGNIPHAKTIIAKAEGRS